MTDDKDGNRDGGTPAPAVAYAAPDTDQTVQSQPKATETLESRVIYEQHVQGRTKIGEIERRQESYTGGNGNSYRFQQNLLEAGLDREKLERLPEPMRKGLVRLISWYENPERRFTKQVDTAKGEIGALSVEEKTLMRELYGPNYDRLYAGSSEARLGGLLGKYELIEKQLYESAEGLLGVRDEIKETSQRKAGLERSRNTPGSYKERRDTNLLIRAMDVDLRRYSGLQAKLAGTITRLQREKNIVERRIAEKEQSLNDLNTRVQEATISVSELESVGESRTQERDYSAHIDRLSKSLHAAEEIATAEVEYGIQRRGSRQKQDVSLEVHVPEDPTRISRMAEQEEEQSTRLKEVLAFAEGIVKGGQAT